MSLRILCYLCFALLVGTTLSTAQKCKLAPKSGSNKFPKHFKFGAATASYQIEGGWNEDGKGPSIWDTLIHKHPELIADHSNADVGPDSYHRFDQDLAALKELKVNHYRFSVSWPRLFPTGDISSRNRKGFDYYNMVIDKLLKNNIEPMITMYHYEFPTELSKIVSFTNPLFIDYFAAYAEELFKNFGDRVKHWITFNEPSIYCTHGYAYATHPPMIDAPGVGDYLCMDITLKAHAKAYRLYKRKYFRKQKGKIGISLLSHFFFSRTNDTNVVERALQYGFGFLAHPIFSRYGNYPDILIEDIRRNSLQEGRPWSRLKPLDRKWKNLIKGSADFLGLNYYISQYVESRNPEDAKIPSFEHDGQMVYSSDPKWKKGKSEWLYCVPEGLEYLLKWIRDNYNNVEVIITENGWSDGGGLNDTGRIEYLKSHLQAVLNAINDGCNVTGYTHWSLMDNFQWMHGYTERFGLYHVDMLSENKTRTAKFSAQYYRKVIETSALPKYPLKAASRAKVFSLSNV